MPVCHPPISRSPWPSTAPTRHRSRPIGRFPSPASSARDRPTFPPARRPPSDPRPASAPRARSPAPRRPDASGSGKAARQRRDRIPGDVPSAIPCHHAPPPIAEADAATAGAGNGHARHRPSTLAPAAPGLPAAAPARAAAQRRALARTAPAAPPAEGDNDGTPRRPRAAAVPARPRARLPSAHPSSGTGAAACGLGGMASSAL